MTTETQDRTETLHEHRETIQRAKDTLYEGTNVDKVFYRAQAGLDALNALATVSLALWDLSVADFPDREVDRDELPYTKVRQLAPMRESVAHAIIGHINTFKQIHKTMHSEICDHEEIIQDLTRALADYGPDVGMPVLEAAKTLDLSHEEEA